MMGLIRYCLLLGGILLIIAGIAQNGLTGKVLDRYGKPLASASIFLTGTSFGTVANEQGAFALYGMPAGKYDLIVSCVGYKTQSTSIDTRIANEPMTFTLELRTDELDNVVIGPGEEAPWEKWGQFFLDNFIGTMPESRKCVLENKQAVRFRNYRKQNLLRASSSKPLIITNNALGYKVTYQLEDFQYDYSTKIIYYFGYVLFEPLVAKNDRKLKQWEAARMDVYYGSQLHFFRSLYRNTQLEEGYEMRKLIKKPNLEKERVKALMKKQVMQNGVLTVDAKGSIKPATNISGGDSSLYYRGVLKQSDEIAILVAPILPGDSVAFQVNPYTAGLQFRDYLQIIYVKAKEDPAYLKDQGREGKKSQFQESTLKMNEKGSVEISSLGILNDPLLLLNSGYWGWRDKVGTMLPVDYKPPVKK